MSTERIELVKEHTQGPTVLDLGAVQHNIENVKREKWLHDHLVRNFERVIGVDILAKEIETLNKQGYEMVQADVTEMSFAMSFDTVVAGELIEHVDNPGLMLERVHQHLKPDGRFILTTPNPWAWIFLKRMWHNFMQINNEHVAWYGPVVMEQLLERYGFELIETEIATRRRAGIMKWLQKLGKVPFNGTTWVFVAEKQ